MINIIKKNQIIKALMNVEEKSYVGGNLDRNVQSGLRSDFFFTKPDPQLLIEGRPSMKHYKDLTLDPKINQHNLVNP